MISDKIYEQFRYVSSDAGVYLMKDDAGKVIYVGKASNLKKRLASYVNPSDQSNAKTFALIRNIADIETIITASELEALMLESNLIKKYKPRYNVILKDDKRYPSLRLDIRHPYPNLEMVRKPQKDGALYFGPYASSGALYETLHLIHKTFRLRKCKTNIFKNRSRPCLNYQIGVCLAPCCLEVSHELYQSMVKEVILLLKGRTPDLIRNIKAEMLEWAELQEYEKAAQLRDKLFALEKIAEKQVSVSTDIKDKDVIAFVRSSEYSVFTMLFVRGGCLIGTRHFNFKETLSTDAELMETFIRQYYEKAHFIPDEILAQIQPDHAALIEARLKDISGKKVKILQHIVGEKVRLLKMAYKNAEKKLTDLITSLNSETEKLSRLQQKLKLDRLPVRIECFDNSNISGTSPVAGMVVFENGKPDKSSYRKYKIRSVSEQDDYAYMSEVLTRRFGKGEDSKPYPDLLMVDGGKGQIGIAVSVLRELGLEKEFTIIGIAKKDEKKGEHEDKIYMAGRADPVQWGREKDLLLFLEHIRDEAHRFAISFHRKQRQKASVTSILDNIPGLGPKRKKMLITHFGSIRNIQDAGIEELIALPGITAAIAEAVLAKMQTKKRG
jgi:excinuclease ABC subunit C